MLYLISPHYNVIWGKKKTRKAYKLKCKLSTEFNALSPNNPEKIQLFTFLLSLIIVRCSCAFRPVLLRIRIPSGAPAHMHSVRCSCAYAFRPVLLRIRIPSGAPAHTHLEAMSLTLFLIHQ